MRDVGGGGERLTTARMCPHLRVFCECVSFPVGVNRRQGSGQIVVGRAGVVCRVGARVFVRQGPFAAWRRADALCVCRARFLSFRLFVFLLAFLFYFFFFFFYGFPLLGRGLLLFFVCVTA